MIDAPDVRIFRNAVLASIPRGGRERIAPHLTSVSLIKGQVIHEAGETIRDVYFPERCVVSVMADSSGDQNRIEVAAVGTDGMTGLPALLGAETLSSNVTTVRIPGEAYRLRTSELHRWLDGAPDVKRMLMQQLEIFLAQLSQAVACNTQHSLVQRLARWLLTAEDRAKTDEDRAKIKGLSIKHECLAVMLGAYRPSVTVAITVLTHAGGIRHSRSHIDILDRDILQASACDCYARMLDITQKVRGRSPVRIAY